MKALDQDGRTCLALARAAHRVTGATEVSGAQTGALIDLLVANGCPEQSNNGSGPTVALRHNNILPLDKLPASVI